MRVESKPFMLPGSVGLLQAIIDQPVQMGKNTIGSAATTTSANHYIAVCCHPHPLHGGAMSNKVIYTASRSLAALGIISIRFNFRGVDKSEGQHDHGIGEQDDLKAVVEWADKTYPNRDLILCGFSFGSHISALQAKPLNSQLLINIAPPIGRIPLLNFIPPSRPWLVIQGDEDELVEHQQVTDWVNSFEPQAEYIKMSGASHFFHGQLTQLRTAIETFTSQALELN